MPVLGKESNKPTEKPTSIELASCHARRPPPHISPAYADKKKHPRLRKVRQPLHRNRRCGLRLYG